jgi:putative GTP pyrophosphokinase
LAQHSWAEASSILQYKRQESIPRPLRRSIGRVSALLETIDLEFDRLLDERDKYRISLRDEVTSEAQLNVDILSDLLDRKIPLEFKRTNEDYSILVQQLGVIEYDSIGKLELLIEKFRDSVMVLNDRICVGFKSKLELHPESSVFEGYYLSAENRYLVKNGVYFSQTGFLRKVIELDLGYPFFHEYNERKRLQLKNKS